MKKIVVLGAGGGIGKEVAKRFSSEDFEVYALSHKALDVTNKKDFDKLPTEIDCLINCAGYFDEEDFLKMYGVNVNGAINSVDIPILKNKMAKNSYAFVITSSAGIRENKDYPIYSMTKRCAENRIKEYAEEMIVEKVFINTIAPCRVRTPMRSKITKDWKTEPALEPEEVAEFIYKLYNADLRLYGHTFDLRMEYKR